MLKSTSNYKSLLMEKAFCLESRYYLFDKWKHCDVEADAKRIALCILSNSSSAYIEEE